MSTGGSKFDGACIENLLSVAFQASQMNKKSIRKCSLMIEKHFNALCYELELRYCIEGKDRSFIVFGLKIS